MGRNPAAGRTDVGDAEGLWYTLRPRVAYAWVERDHPKTAMRLTFEQSG